MEINHEQGVVTKVSSQNFEDTYKLLKDGISNSTDLKIVAELDHKANAASVGLKICSTKVIVFGKPERKIPLMKSTQIKELDLPQKMLVWEDDEGVVRVSYNDPKQRMLKGTKNVLNTISAVLDRISDRATGAC